MHKKNFNRRDKNKIIRLYSEGLSTGKIAEMFEVGDWIIQYRLREWGHNDPKRRISPPHKKKFSEKDKKDIIYLYEKENLSMREIGKLYGVSKVPIKRCLNAWGIDTSPKKYQLDHDFFNKIDTEEKAYWLGFISADGSVGVYRGKHVLSLGLHKKDIDHLYKFKKSINAENPVYDTEKNKAKITIYSETMVTDLMKYGVVQRKSLILKPYYDIPEHLRRHYWRGFVDGDGSVRIALLKGRLEYPSISLSGTTDVCECFADFCREYCNSKANLTSIKGNFCSYGIVGSYAVPIIYELYHNATVYLTRKKLLADKILYEAGWYD